MARKLSPLTAELVLDIKKWTAGISQAQRDSKAITASLKPLTDTTKQLGTAFVAAGALIGGSLLAMAKKAADYGDEMLEASQKTGITTKNLAALRLVAEQSGSSFEGVTNGVTKLSKSLFEAGTKGGEAAKTFSALGISVKDSAGNLRQASDILPEVAERFATMRDGTEKTAVAIRLFGKAGADLIPMLNQGADGFRKAADAVEKYNIDVGVAASKMGDELNDSLKETSLATQGLANQIGAALLPSMIKLVTLANNAIAAVSGLAKAHPGWTQAIAATAAALTGAGGLLLGLTAILIVLPKIHQSLALMKAMVLATNPVVLAISAAVIAVTVAFAAFPQIRKPVLDTFQQIYQGAALVVGGLTNLAFAASKVATGNMIEAWRAIKALPSNVMDDIMDAGDRFQNFSKGIGDLGKTFDMGSIAGDAKKLAAELNGMNLDGFGKEAKEAATQVDTMWKALQREATEAADLEKVLARANKEHISEHVILEKLGPTISQVAAESRLYGDKLGPFTAKMVKMKDAIDLANKSWDMQVDLLKSINEAASLNEFDPSILLPIDMSMPGGGPLSGKNIVNETAEEFKRSWGRAFGEVSDQLVDMIVDMDFSFKRLGDIAKNTAKSLATSFLDGFLKPFRDGLSGLGETLASVIMGGGKGGGLFSAFGGLGGLFGGGGGGQPANGQMAGVPIGGGGASGISSLMGWASVASNALGPILDQVGKIGAGRDSANEIVKAQNAFQQSLASILNDSGLSSTNKLKQVGNVWDAFQTNLGHFSAAGGENAVTANQSFATLSPLVSKIQSDLIKSGATDGMGGGGLTVAPVFHIYGFNELTVRDEIMPAITSALESGVRGYTEKWSQLLSGDNGSTPAVTGI